MDRLDTLLDEQEKADQRGLAMAVILLGMLPKADILFAIMSDKYSEVLLNKALKKYVTEMDTKLQALLTERIKTDINLMKRIYGGVGSVDYVKIMKSALRRPFATSLSSPLDSFNAANSLLSRKLKVALQRKATGGAVTAAEIRKATAIYEGHMLTTFQTMANAVQNEAREEFFAENPKLVSGVIIAAVLDKVTTDFCRAINGTVCKVNEGPRPPFHTRCRTTVLPILTGQDVSDVIVRINKWGAGKKGFRSITV